MLPLETPETGAFCTRATFMSGSLPFPGTFKLALATEDSLVEDIVLALGTTVSDCSGLSFVRNLVVGDEEGIAGSDCSLRSLVVGAKEEELGNDSAEERRSLAAENEFSNDPKLD